MTDNPITISWYLKQDYTGYKFPVEIPDVGRKQLAETFGELGFKTGVEVGVARGTYSEILLQSNPNLEMLWGVDPYEPQLGYKDYTRSETFNLLKSDAHATLDKYPNYTFIETTSLEAATAFDNGSLDFVYIDGDHSYEHVVADIAAWLPKIRKGGIISGDDFFKGAGHSKMHVVQAVKGYTDAYQIKPWFVLGRQAKIEGEIRDDGRSWMWVV